MPTIAECLKQRADEPRRKLTEARSYLLGKIDWQIKQLKLYPQDAHPRTIIFKSATTTYVILNRPERLQHFRTLIERCPGWLGKSRTGADRMRAEYKQAGCRGGTAGVSFRDAVDETAAIEQDIDNKLKNARFRLEQYRKQENKAEQAKLEAVSNWYVTSREIDDLLIKQKQALINSSYARGEQAEFEAFIGHKT